MMIAISSTPQSAEPSERQALGQNVDELAEAINAEHTEVIKCVRGVLQHAKAAGDLLIQIKQIIGHGDWEQWLLVNIRVKPRTARNYMRIAREWDAHVHPLLKQDPGLSIEGAISVLRERDAEPTVVVRRYASVWEEVRKQLKLKIPSDLKNLSDEEISQFDNNFWELWDITLANLRSIMQIGRVLPIYQDQLDARAAEYEEMTLDQ